ncbi:cyclase family protein, partial [bacterium]|nr:cyclase family protein [bacterium]
NFNGEQPNSYNVPRASAKAYEDGIFVGDTRRGGSCNFEEYRLIPHCNGTHTECVGHLSLERISLHTILKDAFIPVTLITIEGESPESCEDSCDPSAKAADLLLTKRRLKAALDGSKPTFWEGLVIRTVPNDASKKSLQYLEYAPPYLTLDGMQWIVETGVKHLLMDVPSVDRILDEGRMSTHRLYWNVPQGSHEVSPNNHSLKTITEMVYVPNDIPDGRYLLNLQVPALVSDAAPSRPILYPIECE